MTRCPDCDRPMTELFTSVVCDHCDPADAPVYVEPEITREFDVGEQWRFDITTDPDDPSICMAARYWSDAIPGAVAAFIVACEALAAMDDAGADD